MKTMSDKTIVKALEQRPQDAESISLLAAGNAAEVAAAVVERAKAGQVSAISALAEAGELGRLED
jgi:hypothetical protein